VSKKYPYQIGDLIHNKKSKLLFLIENIDKTGVYFHIMPDDKRMYMKKCSLKDQLESEQGKESLVYYSI
jgi:hypothetical protein